MHVRMTAQRVGETFDQSDKSLFEKIRNRTQGNIFFEPTSDWVSTSKRSVSPVGNSA
jgi:hypothetical protein